jgi:apolipoprotein N-acyltransferase
VRGVLARVLFTGSAGVAAGLAFPPFHLWLLLPPAVACLSLATREVPPRRGFLLGTSFGLGFLLFLMPWLRVVGTDAWIGLCVMEALFYGALGWGLVRVSRLPGWPLWGACLWVVVESLRGVIPWGGFNWGRLAFTAIDTPVAPAVTYVGAAGLTFLIALIGGLLAWVVVHGRSLPSVLVTGGAVALACAPLVLPDWTSPHRSIPNTVAVVQGNVPGEGLNAFAERRAVLNNHVKATRDLADQVAAGKVRQPDLVLWPENSTDIDPFQDPSVMRDISGAVDAIGAPTLVGAMVTGPGPIDVKNEGIVWIPGVGPTNSYAKMHPVPFGEYIPMRKFLAKHIQRLNEIPRDMVPGSRYGLLKLGDTTVGDVICFEVIYDDLIRTVVDRGAELLVVQTNNATYMGTGQVDQQFAVARLRALETHRYVAVAATNGISAIVDPNGRVVAQAPKRTQSVLIEDVPRLTSLTPAVRLGAWIERGMIAVGLLAIGASLLVHRRRSGSGDTDAGRTEEHAEKESAGSTPGGS